MNVYTAVKFKSKRSFTDHKADLIMIVKILYVDNFLIPFLCYLIAASTFDQEKVQCHYSIHF